MKHKILLVEDEQSVGQMLKEELARQGFEVDWVLDGFSALKRVLEEEYDLILLDLMIPKIDGLKVCRQIREVKSVPIIILTAKGQVEDRVEGLAAGADDYIVKPFSFAELSARIGAVLRRSLRESPQVLKAGPVTIRLSSMEVLLRGQKIQTTKREFQLLKFLVERKNSVVFRDEIYSKVWGYAHEHDSNIVDVYVRNLRRKLSDHEHRIIKTIRGIGYMIDDSET
ncbi:MAG: response regulator transcription factor [Aquificaceae bacterium]